VQCTLLCGCGVGLSVRQAGHPASGRAKEAAAGLRERRRAFKRQRIDLGCVGGWRKFTSGSGGREGACVQGL
jgi:hypothetical protein